MACLATEAGQLPPHRRSERGSHSSTAGGRQLHGSLGFLARPPPAAALPKLAAAGEPGRKPVGNPAAQILLLPNQQRVRGASVGQLLDVAARPCFKLREALWAWRAPLAWCPCLPLLMGKDGGSCAVCFPLTLSAWYPSFCNQGLASIEIPGIQLRGPSPGGSVLGTKLADNPSGQWGTVRPDSGAGSLSCQSQFQQKPGWTCKMGQGFAA